MPTVYIKPLRCKRPTCKREWFPRTDKMPKVCPHCKHPGWNDLSIKRKK